MRIFLSTADASGDLHAAAMVSELRSRLEAHGEPLELFGLGGEALRAQGLRSVARQEDLTVGGLFEVLPRAPRILAAYRALRSALLEQRPELVILVDTPDLNLPLAAVASRARAPVFYYIAPQVWAWRTGRVRKLRERVTHLGVIFPFEAALFNDAAVPATFVGHPLVDRMHTLEQTLDAKETARELGLDPGRPLLGLLPGSRRNEIARNLAPMVQAAELLIDSDPDLQVRLLLAPTLDGQSFALPEQIAVIRGRIHEAMAVSTALLAAPGTVNVEAALLGVPQLVTHTVNRFSFALARRITRVPSSCMVNLIADEGVVPERLQQLARPAALAAELSRLLRNPLAREQQRDGLARATARLGGPGAAGRAAALALSVAGRNPGRPS